MGLCPVETAVVWRQWEGCGEHSSPPALPSTSCLAFGSSFHPSGSQFLNVQNAFLVQCYSIRQARLGCAAVTDHSKISAAETTKVCFLLTLYAHHKLARGSPYCRYLWARWMEQLPARMLLVLVPEEKESRTLTSDAPMLSNSFYCCSHVMSQSR